MITQFRLEKQTETNQKDFDKVCDRCDMFLIFECNIAKNVISQKKSVLTNRFACPNWLNLKIYDSSWDFIWYPLNIYEDPFKLWYTSFASSILWKFHVSKSRSSPTRHQIIFDDLLHLILFKISSWLHQEFHFYTHRTIDYPVSFFPRSDDSEMTIIFKSYTNSTRISSFEIVSRIVSSYDGSINLHCLSIDVSLNRKWEGSVSWYNSISSTSSDDYLRIQELRGLQDTFFSLDIIVTLRSI